MCFIYPTLHPSLLPSLLSCLSPAACQKATGHGLGRQNPLWATKNQGSTSSSAHPADLWSLGEPPGQTAPFCALPGQLAGGAHGGTQPAPSYVLPCRSPGSPSDLCLRPPNYILLSTPDPFSSSLFSSKAEVIQESQNCPLVVFPTRPPISPSVQPP